MATAGPFAERERKARERAKERVGTYDSLFRLRFNLTVNDPRYLESTLDEMAEAYWESHYDQRRRNGDPDEEEIEDEEFDQDEIERLMAEHPDDWMDVLNSGGGE